MPKAAFARCAALAAFHIAHLTTATRFVPKYDCMGPLPMRKSQRWPSISTHVLHRLPVSKLFSILDKRLSIPVSPRLVAAASTPRQSRGQASKYIEIARVIAKRLYALRLLRTCVKPCERRYNRNCTLDMAGCRASCCMITTCVVNNHVEYRCGQASAR